MKKKYLMFAMLCLSLLFGPTSCSRKTGCPMNEQGKTGAKTGRNGKLSSKKGKSELFPKSMRKSMGR
jgi:hypothetical protein